MHFFIPTLGVASLLLGGAAAGTVFSSAVDDVSSEFHWPAPPTSRIIVNSHYSVSTAVSSEIDSVYSPPPAVSNDIDPISNPDWSTWSAKVPPEVKTTTVQTIVVTARPTRTRTFTHFVTPTETTNAGDETSAATTIVAPGISTSVTPCFSAVTGRSTLTYTVTAPWTRTYTHVFTVKTSAPCGPPDYTASTETEISPTTVDPGVNSITHVSTVFHTVTTHHTLTPTSAYSGYSAFPSGSTTSVKIKTKTKTSTKTKTGTKTKICHPHSTSLITLIPPVSFPIPIESLPPVSFPAPIESFPTPIKSDPVITYTLLPPVSFPTPIDPPAEPSTRTLIPPVQLTPPYPTATNTDGIATSFGYSTGTVGTTSKHTSTVTASASASAHYSAPPPDNNGGNTVAFRGPGVLMGLCAVAGVMAVL